MIEQIRRRMPANESSLRVYFEERFHGKVVYEKYAFYKY